jgi:ribonucleoside-diphosphate reductase alpha chain
MELPSQVIKRDGRHVAFDEGKIRAALSRAFAATGIRDESLLQSVVSLVLEKISARYGAESTPSVEEIQDLVEQALVELNLYSVAKAYVVYRKEHERIREEKKKILGRELDEVDKRFSVNALRLLASRYLLRDATGALSEGPKQMFQRVAALVALTDLVYDPEVYDVKGVHSSNESDMEIPSVELSFGKPGAPEYTLNRYHVERLAELFRRLSSAGHMKLRWPEFIKWAGEKGLSRHNADFRAYYELMVEREFLPNSPTLFNAGTRLGQLSACFVLPIEDSIESIMDAAKEAAVIFKSGGGVGINYSPLRPEGDSVASTGGVASGPVSFMRIIDTLTDVVKQGGKRRGANMGILEVSHPDIERFIHSKTAPGNLENFNISVMVLPDFWECYNYDRPYPLVNPRDGSVWKEVNAKELLGEMARAAWASGDPGLVFFDNINRYNPLLTPLGPIRCTNPCGEEPLYPYESCNLGSLNLRAFVKEHEEKRYIDWDALEKATRIATRFLDNVIDVNRYPITEIERTTLETRRIGLGLMGLADTLYALGIPYNSEEGFSIMSRLAQFVSYHSLSESVNLASERGPFPLFEKSSYARGDIPLDGYHQGNDWSLDWNALSRNIKKVGLRNSHTMTVAPTGSISMIAEVSSGLEPQYALVFEKHVTVGRFYYIDPELESELKRRNLDVEAAVQRIAANGGSLQGLEDVPDDLKNVFLTAYDIPWWDHVRAQFEVQKWVGAAVSKTINMPAWVEPEDVLKAYTFAYRLGLKGITVYRDTSKSGQVLVAPVGRLKGYPLLPKNRTLDMMVERGIAPPAEKAKSTPPKVPTLQLVTREEERIEFSRCPSCGSTNLANQEGCVKCLDCGWSNCILA